MDKLTASLEIIKFIAQNQSFDELNISQKTKKILENFREFYNQIPEEVTEIDTVEINSIGSKSKNKDRSSISGNGGKDDISNSGGKSGSPGKDDISNSGGKSRLLSTDVIITGRLGAATASARVGQEADKGGSSKPGGKTGPKGMSLDSSSNLEILSTDVIITGRLSQDSVTESSGPKNRVIMDVTITGSLSLSEGQKAGGGGGAIKFFLPTDVTIPELRITDVVIFETKGGGDTLTGGKQPPLE